MHRLHNIVLLLLTLGKENVFGSEIINGAKAPEEIMQYMASVQTGNGVHICGGFLISEEFVITAAHCEDQNPQSVVLGSHNLNKVDDETMRYEIKKCKYPLKETTRAHVPDIMLLKLSRKAPLKPVPLPQTVVKLMENTKCSVAGWGLTKTNGFGSQDLRVANVSIISHEVCGTLWAKVRVHLPEEVICAGGYNSDKGFCQGDSGGPLVCSGTAVGVVSFNFLRICDYPNFPNVYTDLRHFLPWIKSTLEQNDC